MTLNTPVQDQVPVESEPLLESKGVSTLQKSRIIPSKLEMDAELRNGTLIAKRVSATTAALNSVKEQVKASSSILRYGIESLENVATPLTQKVMSKVDSVVVKNLDKLSSSAYTTVLSAGAKIYSAVDTDNDGKISASEMASAPVNIFKGLVVNAEWFNNVDKIINPNNITPETLLSRFNEAASTELKRLVDAAQSMQCNAEQFVKGLSGEMRDAWDSKLKTPALAFFNAAMAEYKNADSIGEALAKLEPVWEQQVVSVFRARLRPAVIVYKNTMKMYTTYRKMAEEEGLKVSAEAFLGQVQNHLHDAYDERLAPLMNEFYDGASKLLSEDLERIAKALDLDADNKITLSDLWLMGNSLVKKLVSKPYQTVLRSTLQLADHVVPEDESSSSGEIKDASDAVDTKTVVKDLSLSLVTKTISKRLITKAFMGLANLKVRTTALVGPDLISYAESLYKDANAAFSNSTKAVVENKYVQDYVLPAVSKLEKNLSMLKAFLNEKVATPVTTATAQLMNSARAAELKRRFAVAMQRARDFTGNSVDYLAKRELLLLPTDLGEFLAMGFGLKKKDSEYATVVELVSGLFASVFDVVKIVQWKDEKVQKLQAEPIKEEVNDSGTIPTDEKSDAQDVEAKE